MRHTFAHFAVAFLTGALTAPIMKSFLSDVLTKEWYTVHSIDNYSLNQPEQGFDRPPLQTVEESAQDQHRPRLIAANDAFLAPTAAVYGKSEHRIGLAKGSRIMQRSTLAIAPSTLENEPYQNAVFVNDEGYAIYIGERSTIDMGARLMSPVLIEQDVYVGPGAILSNACLRTGVIVENGAIVCDVEIPPFRRIRAGQVVRNPYEAEHLPFRDQGEYLGQTRATSYT
ncbi:hypothetical protein [Sulfoacidibacillus thermotolerans]|uniref:Uncharacterized protein n=1 Tax=Sulfoacidibacillus thermotolerans TaxID=1765684 RepID=A0A2U3D9D3_SULT2|nr:hypothetical protein [Sulfoacidibacillus thermotolerans]PWI57872.1 hypothetical protein BM613_06755 [Sulfoacidibacillus thermotolerans]